MGAPVASFTIYTEIGRVHATIASWDAVRAQVASMRNRDITITMRALYDEVLPIFNEEPGLLDFSFIPSEAAMVGLRELAVRFSWSLTETPGPW